MWQQHFVFRSTVFSYFMLLKNDVQKIQFRCYCHYFGVKPLRCASYLPSGSSQPNSNLWQVTVFTQSPPFVLMKRRLWSASGTYYRCICKIIRRWSSWESDWRQSTPLQADCRSKTHIHILAENKTVEGGWVPKYLLNEQMKLVNKAFSKWFWLSFGSREKLSAINTDYCIEPANIRFDVKDIDYHIYHDWEYVEIDNTGNLIFGPDLATKKKLRKGDYKTLNVFIMHQFGVFQEVISPPGVRKTHSDI